MQGLMQGLMLCLSNFKKIQWILSPVMSSVCHWKLQLQITPLMPMIGMPVNHHHHHRHHQDSSSSSCQQFN